MGGDVGRDSAQDKWLMVQTVQLTLPLAAYTGPNRSPNDGKP